VDLCERNDVGKAQRHRLGGKRVTTTTDYHVGPDLDVLKISKRKRREKIYGTCEIALEHRDYDNVAHSAGGVLCHTLRLVGWAGCGAGTTDWTATNG
jgi:hypothetical protein